MSCAGRKSYWPRVSTDEDRLQVPRLSFPRKVPSQVQPATRGISVAMFHFRLPGVPEEDKGGMRSRLLHVFRASTFYLV